MTSRPYHKVLEATLGYANEYLESLDDSSVSASRSFAELRAKLDRPLNDEGIEPTQVIRELVTDTSGGIVGSGGGRFFGWVVGGAVPAALAADWLASAWDQNAASYTCAPAEIVIEEIAATWIKELLSLPSSASVAFITGCQMAHLTCLAAARNGVLANHGWDVERKGLVGAPAIRILSSNQRHGSIERAVRLLGLGSDCIVDLPVDETGRLASKTLEKALLEAKDMPVVVLLQAGDVNTGVYDLFAELVPLSHTHRAWVHVDGAFGLWVAASSKLRHLLAGVEAADSWATDGHKWLNVPYDCGYAIVANRDVHRNSMKIHNVSYVARSNEVSEPSDWSPEWSRRGRAIPTYAAIRELGRIGIANLVERCCKYAHQLTIQIGSLSGAELVWEPQINQGLVRFLSAKPNANSDDHDKQTDAVISAIVQSGEAFFSGTTWRGKRCMRISVCNWQTSESDVNRALTSVEQAILRTKSLLTA